ncbi:MAG: aminodeoxychorismate synthase component I [Burkholderiales bacterium]|nr:aminodeoxychorismate synthase component I [Burkholderiales bacterium]MBH2017416.1 aminodeoxychorismate synthase component I [Burkholderiales bacterium]
MPGAPTALLDFPPPEPGQARQRLRLSQPQRWLVAHDPAQVPGLLDAAHQLAKEGRWVVGWVAYEAAPGLDACLPVKALPPGRPFAVWAVFDQAEPWADTVAPPNAQPDTPSSAPWAAGPWTPALAEPEVSRRIERVRELIQAGEVYQVNLTDTLSAPFDGGPQAIEPFFEALRRSQPAGYSLMLDARAACRSPGVLLSVSPELFFDWDGQALTTRPMKGTAARGADEASDQAAAEHLRTSPKERAENLMIVDLLRNDLSRVAEVGSVRVPSLFDLQALPTVWQMTSTITARSRPGLRLSEVFAALFPCGSVTGAPKRQAMHHIARLEAGPRGVYCGAVGLMAPGGRVTFNVPIRTVVLDTPPPDAPWRARCGIGSGITLDARPESEWQEWQAKQAFLKRASQPFSLLESMRLENGQLHRLPRHLARLAASAEHFGFAWRPEAVRSALQSACLAHPHGTFKLRLLLSAHGHPTVEAAALAPPSPQPPTVALAERPMPAADDFIRHKTTRRDAYVAFAAPAGCFDTLLFNQAGELTEFTIGNVALRLGGQWFTPPLSAGMLPGVMRAESLAQGRLQERRLTLSDLAQADEVALLNSVRGWLTVRMQEPTQEPG